ncbi:MAG: hypothetical protein EZS28_032790, partial [Streblomastix strix]
RYLKQKFTQLLKLDFFGKFSTERRKKKWYWKEDEDGGKSEVTLEFDKVTLPGKTVYQLEIETSQHELIQPIIEKKLQEGGVVFTRSTMGKLAMFKQTQYHK